LENAGAERYFRATSSFSARESKVSKPQVKTSQPQQDLFSFDDADAGDDWGNMVSANPTRGSKQAIPQGNLSSFLSVTDDAVDDDDFADFQSAPAPQAAAKPQNASFSAFSQPTSQAARPTQTAQQQANQGFDFFGAAPAQSQAPQTQNNTIDFFAAAPVSQPNPSQSNAQSNVFGNDLFGSPSKPQTSAPAHLAPFGAAPPSQAMSPSSTNTPPNSVSHSKLLPPTEPTLILHIIQGFGQPKNDIWSNNANLVSLDFLGKEPPKQAPAPSMNALQNSTNPSYIPTSSANTFGNFSSQPPQPMRPQTGGNNAAINAFASFGQFQAQTTPQQQTQQQQQQQNSFF
jgi:hypothetical protein